MKASTRNLMIGTFHEVKGGLRTSMGTTLANRRLAYGGRVERVGGKVRANFGRFERIFGW